MPKLIFPPTPQRKQKVEKATTKLLYSPFKNYWISESRYRSPPPTVRSFIGQANYGGNNPTATINLPEGYQEGDLLVLHASYGQNNNFSPPSGWTELANSLASGSSRRNKIYYRLADGTEGPSVTVTFGENARKALTIYCIQKDTFDPDTTIEFSVNSSGVTATDVADPAPLTPSWGSANTLYLIMSTQTGGGTVSVTLPYPDNALTKTTTSVQGAAVPTNSLCTVISNLTTFDPDPILYVGTRNWSVFTIAVRPLE